MNIPLENEGGEAAIKGLLKCTHTNLSLGR